MNENDKLHEYLDSYTEIKIDKDILYSLQMIPANTQKRFSIFRLLPSELVFSMCSILTALFIGGLFSYYTLNTSLSAQHNDIDYFEQISLASLIVDFDL